MAIFGNLFGQIFGDSAAELEARGDHFAGVNNWRRAVDEYRRALQKTTRNSIGFRRLTAKFDEARIKSFDAIVEDIHSRIDVREFTYAADQIAAARGLVEDDEHLRRLEECEARLQSAGRPLSTSKAAAGTAAAGAAMVVPPDRPAVQGNGAIPEAPAARIDATRPGVPSAASDSLAEGPRGSQRASGRTSRERGAPVRRDRASNERASHEAATRAPAASLASSDRGTPEPTHDQAFQKLLSSMPAQQVAARVRLGPSYRDAALAHRQGDHTRAVDLFIEALDEHSEEPIVLYDLAAALSAAGRTREAQGVYLKLAEQNPNDWQPYYEMSIVLWTDGLRERAVQALEEGLSQHPRSGYLMAQWGVFLAKLGHPRQALEKMYQALQLDSFDDAGLYHAIGNLHLELGEMDKARRGYLKALEVDPHSVGTMLDYAEHLLDHPKDAAAAQAILETAFRTLRVRPGLRLHKVYRSYLSSRAHLLLEEREMALLAVTRALEENDQAWLRPLLQRQRQTVLAV